MNCSVLVSDKQWNSGMSYLNQPHTSFSHRHLYYHAPTSSAPCILKIFNANFALRAQKATELNMNFKTYVGLWHSVNMWAALQAQQKF